MDLFVNTPRSWRVNCLLNIYIKHTIYSGAERATSCSCIIDASGQLFRSHAQGPKNQQHQQPNKNNINNKFSQEQKAAPGQKSFVKQNIRKSL